MNITEILKNSTKEYHKELETIMFSNKLMDKTLSFSEYYQLITVNYIYNSKLEDKINNLKNNEILNELNIEERRKKQLILKDFDELKIDYLFINKIFKNFDLKINNIYDFLAYLYLAEGSTLGGKIILKALKENDNVKEINNFNFYNCYGESTSKMWKDFCSLLNNFVNEDDKKEYVLNSAINAYKQFINIFELSKELYLEASKV